MSDNISDRDVLRAEIFNQKVESEIVTLSSGKQIEVRDSSAGDMIDAVTVKDLKVRMARMMVMCCYVPGTDIKVFEPADTDSIMAMPSGGVYKKIIDAINKRMNVDEQVTEAGNDLNPATPIS